MTKDKPLRHRKLWSSQEEEFLIKNCRKKIKYLSEKLQRTPEAIMERKSRLVKKGLIERQRRGWTDKEDNTLIEMDKKGLLDKEIAEILKRKTSTIGKRRERLKAIGKYHGDKINLVEKGQIKRIRKMLKEGKDILDICIELDISQGTARKRIRRLENEA